MFFYVTLFSTLLLCARGLDVDTGAASSAVTRRQARSIWPFGSSGASAESPISREHALLLEQAGLDKSFNLSSHPLWKIHKYHGIDLKPVRVETEIVKSKTVNEGKNQSTSVGIDASQSDLPDLSFLDDLGGLAGFLPDPEEEDEASRLITNAIEKEESSHPGFFKRLWWKIWGSPESSKATKNLATQEATVSSTYEFISSLFGFAQSQQDTEEEAKEEGEGAEINDDALTIYLPESKGSYMAVVLAPEKSKNPPHGKYQPEQNILLPSQAAPPLFREAVTNVVEALEAPPNHANEYREGTGATATSPAVTEAHENLSDAVAKPVAQWPASGATGSESQAWIQSWTPHAAYTVQVQGAPGYNWQSQAKESNGTPSLPEASQSWLPSEHEPRVQTAQPIKPNSEPSSNLEPPTPLGAVETKNNFSELLGMSWPQLLTQNVPPVLDAFQSTRAEQRSEQQASRKSSQALLVQEAAQPNEKENPKGNPKGNQQENQQENQPLNELGNKAKDDDEDKTKSIILSHFRIPEGLMKKLQVSQKDVDTILNDEESAARAAERLRSLQKEFEMRKEQLSYVYAPRAKKQLK